MKMYKKIRIYDELYNFDTIQYFLFKLWHINSKTSIRVWFKLPARDFSFAGEISRQRAL